MAARRRWAVNVRARALWRKVRFAFWTGVVYRYACYHFEDALCRIRRLEVFGRLTLGDATLRLEREAADAMHFAFAYPIAFEGDEKDLEGISQQSLADPKLALLALG